MTDPAITPVAAITPVSDFERDAIREWCETARASGEDPTTCEEVKGLGLFLIGEAAEISGADCPALAVFQDELGNWSALLRRPGRSDSLITCQFIGGKDVN